MVGYNILLSMVVQQQVLILEFLQEKMSARPSTLPSCSPIEVKIVTFSYSPHAQMTDTDLPVSLQESQVEAWVIRSTEYNSPGGRGGMLA